MNQRFRLGRVSCAGGVRLAALFVFTSVSLLVSGCGTANQAVSSDGSSGGAVMSNREAVVYAASHREWYEDTKP